MPGNCFFSTRSLHSGMTFDARQIAAFLSIARHGSLGRAADAMHVTQPALSRIVRRLGHMHGVGGAPEAAMAGNAEEGGDLAGVESHTGM
ncbi:MAG: LysR family transcriptional regulator [Oxalobacteraceae bacterium]|nr:MAG: LysR family transcriptional regulator [Oxalobacteraceae bacterium]